MLFVGIDVAKSKHDCCIIDSDGVIINDSLRISNTREGFDMLYTTILSALDSSDYSNVKIGLESTGHYSTNITNYLYSKGFSITVLNPLVTNAFRKAGTLLAFAGMESSTYQSGEYNASKTPMVKRGSTYLPK